jgi:hypothetical protein
MAKTRQRKLARVVAAGNGGGSTTLTASRTTARCALCNAEIRPIPRVVQGAIPVRCESCFGAAPRTEGISLGDWLDRSSTPRYTRLSEQGEELAEAA